MFVARQPGAELSSIGAIFASLKMHAPEVARTNVRERREKLQRLHDAVFRNKDEIRRASHQDLGKPRGEADLSETYVVVGEARHAIRHLRRWMAPQRVGTRLALIGSRSWILHQPKGVVLIMAPWNFPFNLTLGPLVSAVAAGNCVVVKPSELTPQSSAVMRAIVEEVFDRDEVAVVEGGTDVAQELLALPFDHIFFTGSPAVGKIVMRAAAEHLTSVTLELGGKSPAIVDATADIESAARKLAWGKFLNNGQACVSPDYVLVHRAVEAKFTELLRRNIDELYGDARASPSYGRIVSERHHGRIAGMVSAAASKGAEVLIGGTGAAEDRYYAPTLVRNAPPDSDLSSAEIFGPVMPLEPFDRIEDAIQRINQGAAPLVLYLFSKDRAATNMVLRETRAGGTLINDTLIHYYQLNLPFGGVGSSGMGRGHGRSGFEAFSNIRGVMKRFTKFSPLQFLYPPYNDFKEKLIELTVRYF